MGVLLGTARSTGRGTPGPVTPVVAPAVAPVAFSCSNWCSYAVTRTVSCLVQNGTFLQRVFQGCRWPLPCSGGSYRAVVRPAYRVALRTVTALEWRCCPGHGGATCEEGGRGNGGVPGSPHPGGGLRALHPTFSSAGCLNCSRVGELTARLATLEAQVARLSVAEAPPSPAPKGADTGRLWGSPAAQGSPGDEGVPWGGETQRGATVGRDGKWGVGTEGGGTHKRTPPPRKQGAGSLGPGSRGPPGPKGDAGGRGASGPPGKGGPPPGKGASPSLLLRISEGGDPLLSNTFTEAAGGIVGPMGPPGPMGPMGEFPPPPCTLTFFFFGGCHHVGTRLSRAPPSLHLLAGPPGPPGPMGLPGPPGPDVSAGRILGLGGGTAVPWGGLHQLREALKILAERVLILETMIGLYEPPAAAGPAGGPGQEGHLAGSHHLAR
uniref:EMI domain-containing protein n=1 Tax=Anas platyrhynchos TaxID=8839 RepID=A0A8B9QX90_ANAPL